VKGKFLGGLYIREESPIIHNMNSPILDALMDAPDLPELLDEASRAWAREQRLRQKFYADITPEHKWEFIQGEVIMHSPALNRHLLATQRFYNLLNAYAVTRELGEVRVEKAMTSFPRNDYEPDVVFFGKAKAALIDPDTLKFPIPDLIVEVLSPSTEHRDVGSSFRITPCTAWPSIGSSTPWPRPSNFTGSTAEYIPPCPSRPKAFSAATWCLALNCPCAPSSTKPRTPTLMRQIWAQK
jgi:Uma2 family endonuclease